MRPAWREADERLLQRLSDERALEALWREQAPPGAAALPSRAAVLVRAARDLNGGPETVALAERGEARALAELLRPQRVADWPLPLLHAAANYFTRLAEACEVGWTEARRAGRTDDDASWRRARIDSALRAAAAWIALAEQRSYLAGLARTMSRGVLSVEEADAEAARAATKLIDDLGHAAAQGAKSLEPAAAIGLFVLGRTGEACKMAGASGAFSERIVRRAQNARARAIDAALSVIEDAIADARGRAASAKELSLQFAKLLELWIWADRDEAVERFAVDQLSPIAWETYRSSEWATLRELLAPCEVLYDNLEARIVARPVEQLAYAAKCAQVLVFRAEAQTDRAREVILAERALKVCPSHRNARLIVAQLLCAHAIKLLDQATIFSGRSDVYQAAPLIARAEALFPQHTRIQEAKTKLEQARARWGASA